MWASTRTMAKQAGARSEYARAWGVGEFLGCELQVLEVSTSGFGGD